MKRSSIIAIALTCAACSGDEANNDGGDEAPLEYVLVEAEETAPSADACDAVNPTDTPVIALERSQTLETYLAPGNDATTVAIDYEVVPAALVERLEIGLDFDPRRTGESPAAADAEPTIIEERCPTSIELAELAGVVDEPTVVSATVTASDANGADVRRGRLSFSTGDATTAMITEGLDAGAPDSEWYVLFEPLSGIGRITLAPADLSRTTFDIGGIPNETGIVALIQSDELRWDAASRVVYAPQSFGATWRQRVTGWYGRHRSVDEAADTPYLLTSVVKPDQVELAAVRTLSGDFSEAFDLTTRVVLQTSGTENRGTLTLPCSTVQLVAEGFVEVDVDDGRPRTVSPGGSTVLEPACEGDEASIDLVLRSRTARPQSVVISAIEGGE